MTGVDKFNYLKSLLGGTALEAVAGPNLSDPNYKEAIAILERKFGNRQCIIDAYMDQLLNVNAVTSATNLSGLRHLFDVIENHIRSLKYLGVISDSYGSLLSSVFLNKLPPDIRLLISREVSEEDWSLDAVLKQFQDELRDRKQVASDKSLSNSGGSGRGGRQGQHTLMSGGGAVVCCYCQQGHMSRDCKVVTQRLNQKPGNRFSVSLVVVLCVSEQAILVGSRSRSAAGAAGDIMRLSV